MKKIKLFELAKSKNMTTKELVTLLKAKGLKNLRAITYVDPNILGTVSTKSSGQKPVKQESKIAHISSAPSHLGSLATAAKVEPVRESSPEKVLAARIKKAEVAKKKPTSDKKKDETVQKRLAADKKKDETVQKRLATDKKNDSKPKAGGWKWPSAAATVAGLAIILVLALAAKIGMMNQQIAADKAQIASISSGLDSAKLSAQQLGIDVSANKAAVDSLNEGLASLSGKIDGVESSILKSQLTSQLKSQSAVIKGLSTDAGEPLRAQTIAFAEKLAAF